MEALSNNVANANTDGFKADLALQLDPKRYVNGEKDPTAALQLSTDMRQAPLKPTARQLDLAIEGEGFFAVDTPLGTRYTRSGHFNVNDEGNVVTKDGYIVQGAGGAITLEPQDSNIVINESGQIFSLIDGEKIERGSVGVFKFNDYTQLEKVGGSYFIAEDAAQTAEPQQDYKISQFMLEESNVNPIEQMSELIKVTRAVQKGASIMNDQHNLIKDAVSRIASVN